MSALAFRSFVLATIAAAVLNPASPVRADIARKGKSGTAFVVHQDGLLVTCAHVLKGASEIEVVLGNKVLAAEVVAQDEPRDLAVLRVKARGLKPLSMRTSPALLGQEVRAFGYPMTTELGEGLKVTRGTFSGYGSGEVPPLLIDAPVNPGNSGGPLVNESGEVIGVINAKINGPSNLGFAVGTPYVASLLEGNCGDIQFEKNKKEAQTLSGVELVKQVAPSVGLVLAWFDGPAGRLNDQAAWELINGTDADLTLTVDGPEKREIVLPAGKATTLTLLAGDYRVSINYGAQTFRKAYELFANEKLQTRYSF